ncbi:MAG: hypothetical protein QNM02_17090 [Acidimicrobiia bacterium]|nr:hypothetical protein [Acidimicrobiia bacterium]
MRAETPLSEPRPDKAAAGPSNLLDASHRNTRTIGDIGQSELLITFVVDPLDRSIDQPIAGITDLVDSQPDLEAAPNQIAPPRIIDRRVVQTLSFQLIVVHEPSVAPLTAASITNCRIPSG